MYRHHDSLGTVYPGYTLLLPTIQSCQNGLRNPAEVWQVQCFGLLLTLVQPLNSRSPWCTNSEVKVKLQLCVKLQWTELNAVQAELLHKFEILHLFLTLTRFVDYYYYSKQERHVCSFFSVEQIRFFCFLPDNTFDPPSSEIWIPQLCTRWTSLWALLRLHLVWKPQKSIGTNRNQGLTSTLLNSIQLSTFPLKWW